MRIIQQILLILLTSVFALKSQAQCDSIKVYNGDFDKVFQFIYQSIESDSILAVRHCGTTNGCDNTFGLLYWKIDNQTHFQLIKRKNGETVKSEKLKKNLKNHLDKFYKNKLHTETKEIDINNTFWIDDGPLTIAVFKTDKNCWRFNHTAVQDLKDKRVDWINELLILIN